MKSARMTILLDPNDKASLENRAVGLGLNSSEFVRRAVDAYDPDAGNSEVEALARELALTAERTDQVLAKTLERIDQFEDFWRSRETLRTQTLEQIKSSEIDAMERLIG